MPYHLVSHTQPIRCSSRALPNHAKPVREHTYTQNMKYTNAASSAGALSLSAPSS
jgi:hypothetical protein